MTIETALSRGMIRSEDGIWRVIEDGRVKATYHENVCLNCGKVFVASHYTLMYCTRNCAPHASGSENANWKGGRRKHRGTGYIELRIEGKTVGEHRYLMEQHLGRNLLKTEHVHHINGDREDNRLENLVVLSQSEHNSLHKKEQAKTRERAETGQFK